MAGPIRISILADGKQARTELEKTASMGQKIGGRIKSAALPATAALAGIAVAAKGAVDSASKAQQAVGGVQAVFGKYADGVLADSEKAAQGLGLAASEYNELITVSGAMLKNKGLKTFAEDSKSLIGIGADLAAQYGGSTKEAVEALNAAMRGESDPIEKYGISVSAAALEAEALSSGLVKNVKDVNAIKAAQNNAIIAQRNYNKALKEHGDGSDKALAAESKMLKANGAVEKALQGKKVVLDETTKAQAALQLIEKQSADAQGAFGREAETAAGQQQRLTAKLEDLKAEMGEQLLPIVTAVTEKLSGLVTWVSENQREASILVGAVAALAGGILIVNGAMAASGAVMAAWRGAVVGATAVQWLWNAAMTANPLGLIIVVVVAVIAAIALLVTKNEWVREKLGAAWQWIKDKAGDTWDWIKDKFNATVDWFGSLPGRIGDKISGMWDGLKDGFKGAINAIIGWWNNLSLTLNIPDWIPGLPDTFTISTPQIPALAQGGYIPATPGGRIVRVAEAGKAEIVAPERKIEEALARVLNRRGAGGGIYIDKLIVQAPVGSRPADIGRELVGYLDAFAASGGRRVAGGAVR